MTLRGEIVSCLAEVDGHLWDGLVDQDGFYSSYDWLRSQEASPAAAASYALVHDGPDLVAATPLYEFAGWARPALLDPASGGGQWVGPRTGFRQSVLVRRSDGEAHRLRELMHLVAGWASARGEGRLVLAHLGLRDVRLLASTNVTGETSLTNAEAVLDNTGGTFDDYVRSLGARRRKRAAEWRKFRESGLHVDTARLDECVDETAVLIAQTEAKYGSAISEEDIRAYLREQARCVGDRSVVFRCRAEDGALLGVSVCFVWGRYLIGRVAGFRYAQLRDAFEYFNTVYYEPLRYMEAHGLDRLHLGVASWAAKVRRGAHLSPLSTCVYPVPLASGRLRRADPTAAVRFRAQLRAEADGGMSETVWGDAAIERSIDAGYVAPRAPGDLGGTS